MTAKLHELLAVQKTANSNWNKVREETLKKLKAVAHYFMGSLKTLKMLEDTPANKLLEEAGRTEKPLVTTVYATLDYALDLFVNSEDVAVGINATNSTARATVMWGDQPFLPDLPIDELLGLETRLPEIRELIESIPTLDMSVNWKLAPDIGKGVWVSDPVQATKTDTTTVPVVLYEATKEHPAQIKESSKVSVVGLISTVSTTGVVTAAQKAEMISIISTLIIEVKKARMRANQTDVTDIKVGAKIKELLLRPIKPN